MESTGCGPSLLVGAPSAPSGDELDGKNSWGDLAGKIFGVAGARADPKGPVTLMVRRQQHLEALNPHMKSLGTVRPLTRPEPMGMKSAACGALQAHPARHLGTIQTEKAAWGLAGKSLAWRAPGLIPGAPVTLMACHQQYLKLSTVT